MTGPLPPYTHIPGVTPHPIRDPAGHAYVAPKSLHDILEHKSTDTALTWESVSLHPEFQWAVKLFNAGYYWEAHEAWESLWHIAGRTGGLADFLKGLIKLAAAGVKLREHNLAGVQRHAGRARELFQEVATALASSGERFQTLSLEELIALASDLMETPPPFPEDRTGKPVAALPRLPWAVSPVSVP